MNKFCIPCSNINEFIQLVAKKKRKKKREKKKKKRKPRILFYSLTRSINLTIRQHSCKILYFHLVVSNMKCDKMTMFVLRQLTLRLVVYLKMLYYLSSIISYLMQQENITVYWIKNQSWMKWAIKNQVQIRPNVSKMPCHVFIKFFWNVLDYVFTRQTVTAETQQCHDG